MIFLLLVLVLALTGCDPYGPECPTPPPTPIPGETPPPPIDDDPTETPEDDPTQPPIIVTVPADPPEPELPSPKPTPTEPRPTPTVDPSKTPFRDANNKAVPPSLIADMDDHPASHGKGIDLVPDTHREGGRHAAKFTVVALHAGYATNDFDSGGVGPNMVEVKPEISGSDYAIMYSHITPHNDVKGKVGKPVTQGQVLGEVMYNVCTDDYAAVRSGDDHLHLGVRKPAGGSNVDPSYLVNLSANEGLINSPSICPANP